MFSELVAPAIGVVVRAEDSGEFHGPSIEDFFPPAIFFEGTPFEINRLTIIRFIVLAAIVLAFWLFARNLKVVPGRWQSVGEMLLSFVRVNIADDMLGKADGKRFAPLLTTIFIMVLGMNLTGIIPGLNLAGTATIGMPLLLTVIAYVVFIYAGVKKFGAGHYFKAALFPAGVPKWLYPLMTPIEFLSTFVIRPVSLTLRLLMNMVVGHLLLVLCFSATSFFLLEAPDLFKALSGVTLLMGFVFTLFEIMVAVLQAYIFVLLTTAYIQLALEDEH